MNDIDKMPVKCRDCANWELARKPYVCTDCESRMERLSDLSKPKPTDDYIKLSDALKAILGVSIYDTIEELEGARTIAENTWADGLYDAYKIIEEEVDAADVEPVVHGRWIPGKAVYSEYDSGHLIARYYDRWTCSVCNYVINDQHYSRISYKRCPECGAKMDKEEGHERH